MAVMTAAQAQQWLEESKIDLGGQLDSELNRTAETTVLSALSSQYDTSGWTTTGNTPVLVQEITAMLYAAWTYNRQYSANSEEASWYGIWLEGKAMSLLASVVSGAVSLPDLPGQVNDAGQPVYFPTDAATDLADPCKGGDPHDPNGAYRAFTMASRY